MKFHLISSILLLLLIEIVIEIKCARILGVIPTPSFSHQVVFRPIWLELASRGHELVVLTTDPINNSSVKNLKEIDLHGAYDYWNVKDITENSNYDIIAQMRHFANLTKNFLKYELEHPEVQNLIHNKTEHFDLVVVEYLFPSLAVFSHIYNCPYVGITSLDAPIFAHYAMGNPTNPVLYPDFQLPLTPPLNFWGRLISAVFRVLLNIVGNYVMLPTEEQVIKEYFGKDIPSVTEIIENISMLFVNTNPLVQIVRPLGPTTVSFGGGSHVTVTKELAPEIKDYLNSGEIIYFSFGTNVKSSSITPNLMNIILNTLEVLPYKILWKFDADISNLPKNVKIMKWVPQQDILRHPNVKLFITQGGLQSIEEAIYSAVPMVVMPFFGDQEGNARLVVNKGFGISVDRKNVDVETFTKAILEVANNSLYRENINVASDILKDQPISGAEKVAWWIEYVIRHKGAKHLKIATVPWYQYYLLDVIVFLILILSSITYFCYRLLKLVVISSKRVKLKLS